MHLPDYHVNKEQTSEVDTSLPVHHLKIGHMLNFPNFFKVFSLGYSSVSALFIPSLLRLLAENKSGTILYKNHYSR